MAAHLILHASVDFNFTISYTAYCFSPQYIIIFKTIMKLAITGKGGVGKTTTASLLAMIFAADGNKVIAIDANPDANLAAALGIDADELSKITPLSEMKDLIEERTGARPGSSGSIFKLNPKVDDIPDRFSIKKNGITLIVMGTVKKGESGCLCPEGALLKSVVSHLILRTKEVVIMDMDAGVEHLGRGTAKAVDAFIIVVEPGQRSFQTARAIKNLAKDLGVMECLIVGSKTRNAEDRDFIISSLPDFKVIGFINYNPEIAEADRLGNSVYESAPKSVAEVRAIKENLEELSKNRKGG
jgi:CO dehydrogenase maturation factor